MIARGDQVMIVGYFSKLFFCWFISYDIPWRLETLKFVQSGQSLLRTDIDADHNE